MSLHPKSSLPPAFQRLAWSNLAAQLAEQTAQTLPFLLFSIPAGVWADRVPRPRDRWPR